MLAASTVSTTVSAEVIKLDAYQFQMSPCLSIDGTTRTSGG